MKKKILVLFIICLMAFAGTEAYAAEYDVMPCYNVVSMANCAISSEDDGVGMTIWICTANDTALDRVNIEVKLKKASGTTVKTYNRTMDKHGSTFMFIETASVSASGTYYYEYTAKCYKGGSLVDTITSTSKTVSHSV